MKIIPVYEKLYKLLKRKPTIFGGKILIFEKKRIPIFLKIYQILKKKIIPVFSKINFCKKIILIFEKKTITVGGKKHPNFCKGILSFYQFLKKIMSINFPKKLSPPIFEKKLQTHFFKKIKPILKKIIIFEKI